MKKMAVSFCLAIFSICLVAGVAAAQSAKYAAADNTMSVCTFSSTGTLTGINNAAIPGLDCTSYTVTQSNGTTSSSAPAMDGPNWVVLNQINIHTSNSQSLMVTPSLVTGLYTETKNGNGNNSSNAGAKVLLRVVDITGCTLSSSAECSAETVAEPVVDCTESIFGCGNLGTAAAPDYGVDFDERVQTLSSNLSTGEFIDLALSTADGHSFGFGFDDVSSGTHTIAVEAAVLATTGCSGTSCGGASSAAFGLGFTTVEAVQMTQGSNDMNF